MDPEPEILTADDTEEDSETFVKLGDCDPDSGRIVLSPKRTLPTAEAFVRDFYTHPDGRTLVSYAGMLMEWDRNRYTEVEDQTIKNKLQPWLHRALRYQYDRRTGNLMLVDFESNPGTVNSALESTRTYTHLPMTTTIPTWLIQADDLPNPQELLPFRSVNLHIPASMTYRATPTLFTTNALDFDYDPDAPEPTEWLSFLDALWPDDPESIALLQEWFGYCLTADTAQHKMLLLVGPRRSGKGTIGRILTKLIGSSNVAGPTTGSLAGTFGLQPLIGKSLAIVSDARFTGQDIGTVVERLLCISGEDTLTIDRKHKESVTMKLISRFMLLTNELPRLTDASNALAGRFMVLEINQSWFGREDLGLLGRLEQELPGILLWALQGWVRLRQQGRFIQPAASQDAISELEDLCSPVSAFVKQRCLVGREHRVYLDDLYNAWQAWCQSEGRNIVTTKQTFGRDLLAAVPGIKKHRNHTPGGGRFYTGIGLDL
jgi:putative DNA primase/helicase